MTISPFPSLPTPIILSSSANDILDSGGSRLFVNTPTHAAFESQLKSFFHSPEAPLFNSGFDANARFFSAVPQTGDAIVYNEYIHAIAHDGMRAPRVAESLRLSFTHNSLSDLHRVLLSLPNAYRRGKASIFIAFESLYPVFIWEKRPAETWIKAGVEYYHGELRRSAVAPGIGVWSDWSLAAPIQSKENEDIVVLAERQKDGGSVLILTVGGEIIREIQGVFAPENSEETVWVGFTGARNEDVEESLDVEIAGFDNV